MKKYLKILVLIIILSTNRIKGVKAETFYEDNWISGVYANLIDGNFSKPQLMRFIRRKSDNRAVYCITPRVLLYEDEIYSLTADINLNNNQKKRIERLAYFGYGYKNHTSNEWYAITQFMIWQTVEPNMDIFFTDTKGGNRITRFTNEINELNDLVNKYEIYPYIPDVNMLPNSDMQLEDTNNVIYQYELSVPSGINASLNNNNVIIHSLDKGKYTLQFDLSYDRFSNNPYYYSANKGQKILVPGKLIPINFQLDINVISSNIHLTKKDMYTEKKLDGSTYDLYDSNYNYISSGMTDSNGEVVFSNLLYGTYYLLEKKAPIGYQIDNSYHEVSLFDDNSYITVCDEKIKANFILNKYTSDKYMFIPEKKAVFEIYDIDNNLISELVTSSKGTASTILSYGKYRVHQKTSKEGYKKVDDFYVEVLDSDDIVINIKDEKIKEKPKEEKKENDPIEIDKKEEKIIEDKIIPKEIKKETIIDNPKTGDYMIYVYIVLGYIAFIAIIYIISLLKKK